MALEESETTFTRARLEALIDSHRYTPIDHFLAFPWKVNSESDIATRVYLASSSSHPDFNPKRIIYPSSDEASKLYSSFIDNYISLSPDLNRLDECFFQDFIQFNLRSDYLDREIVDETIRLLQRLPTTPIEFHDCEIDPAYICIDDIYFSDSTTKSWETLKATSFISMVVLSLAFTLCSRDDKGNGSSPSVATKLCRDVARLMDELVKRSKESSPPSAQLFVLRTFLWNIWQRTLMLRNNGFLGNIIGQGYMNQDEDFQRKETYFRLLQTAFERSLLSKDPDDSNGTAELGYICQWTYRLFKSNPNALTMDFRHLFDRFRDVFGNEDPRCNKLHNGILTTCDGSSPKSCERFYGRKTEDQSAHATDCNHNCRRLHWSEDSYRKVNGGRAVSVIHTSQGLLHYCSPSTTTIAISHVWSHGQGGRPEIEGTGLNECLHKRYVKIAHDNSADSYWIDTACIPTDHQLRKEAIQNINTTFEGSKFTLVCDLDIGKVDVSDDSIESLERLLAVFLLCDWNVRAWTLLEGMRGRKNIHLLCKNEQVVSLHSSIACLQRQGRLDLSVLTLVVQQLLPAYSGIGKNWDRKHYQFEWDDPRWTKSGIVDPFTAATLLSHRHATRGEDERSDGDIIVIWSLLCSRITCFRAAKLWTKAIEADFRAVPTGFLISSLPRLSTEKNLSWAPRRPDLLPTSPEILEKRRFPAFLSTGSQTGFIEEGILGAIWLRAIIKTSALAKFRHLDTPMPLTRNVLVKNSAADVIFQCLKGYKWGALLRPVHETSATGRNIKSNEDLLRIDTYIPFEYEGDADGILLAVIGSNDMPTSKPEKISRQWKWLDVVEWDKSIELPVFTPAVVYLA